MARVANKGFILAPIEPAADHVRAVAIVPSDTLDLVPQTDRIYVSVAGTVTYLDNNGTSRLVAVAIPGVLKGAFKRIMATGTAATGLLALY